MTDFSYDPAGRLLCASAPDAVLERQWDACGQLLSETVTPSGRPGRTLVNAYDAAGRRTTRTTPCGVSSSWAYDAVGNPTELMTSGRVLHFEYDAVGREVARRLGDGLAFASFFDPFGHLSRQTVTGPDGATVQERTYQYRADGHLTAVSGNGGDRHFDLDAAGRVTGVRGQDWNETYSYDPLGNQTSATWPAEHPGAEALGTRAYTGSRIQRAGQVRYEYDTAGRVVVRQKTRLSRRPDTWRYVWDAEDRLTSVVTPDGTQWRYRYDPLGRRIAKERLCDDGATVAERVDFTWDGTTLCEQTTLGGGLPAPVTLTWNHDAQRPITQAERICPDSLSQQEVDARFYAVVTDLVGTPTELVDEEGGTAWRTRSTLWGTTAWAADSTAYTPLRFPGQYFDPETGLHYNYFRYYDPFIGRYATPDPLGLAPDPNHYGYVDNPHAWIDPLGLLDCTGRADKLNPGEIYLYRSVLSKELDQIAATRTFRNPDGIEVKYFSTNAEGAAAYARQMFGKFPHEGPYTLVRSTIHVDHIPEISRVDLVEAGGIEALALPTEALEKMGRIRILPGMPVP
ncbi:RHS repeat-associated core domain-containing protein [Streptomyces sp. NPDC057413]|uniref:RHS repeat-associated core domain-containing protein n=1 Tax=Streptomyces sp. NPDC057413 TaxID=3346124 RepID=UPI0036C17E5F